LWIWELFIWMFNLETVNFQLNSISDTIKVNVVIM
jgi:hypothetical protein